MAIHKNIKSLDSLPVNSSGLDELNQKFKRDLDYQNYLKQFLDGDNENLDNFFQENPHLIDSIELKALFLLNLLKTGQKILPFHISIKGENPKLADDSAYHLVLLEKKLETGIDLYQAKAVLPSIVIYYSDYLLKEKFFKTKDREALEKAKVVIEANDNFDSFIDENMQAQKYRLRALYYRREAVIARSETTWQSIEENLLLYRKHFQPDLSKAVVLNKMLPQKSFEASEVLGAFSEIYNEVTEIQEEALLRSGVHEDTCFYYECSDCCKKDFPTVSLAEFLYIKNNLSKEELKTLKEKAELIQKDHEDQYGTRLEVVDQALPGKQKENPNNFEAACPFLDAKDMCSIHTTSRPLACRSFGLSTIDSKSVQACSYYLTQYQYNASHRNERDVYDSEPHTKMIGKANEALAKEYGYGHMEQPVGTLVAWLTAKF